MGLPAAPIVWHGRYAFLFVLDVQVRQLTASIAEVKGLFGLQVCSSSYLRCIVLQLAHFPKKKKKRGEDIFFYLVGNPPKGEGVPCYYLNWLIRRLAGRHLAP